MSLQGYLATGYYIDYCGNDQAPITGSGVFTSYLDQCDADGKAYSLAILDAENQRLLNPCVGTGDSFTTTTTTTSIPAEQSLYPSGINFYDWTGYFSGESGFYYDIIAWGDTNGYLSGQFPFEENGYFTSLSANDLYGAGVILAVTKSGTITGFGDNTKGLLNIPNIQDAIDISIGYDHCLVLTTGGTVTGWGNDQWGALNINNQISGIKKARAGVGSSFFLLTGGTITGTNTAILRSISIPSLTNIVDMEHQYGNVIFTHENGYVSGFGFEIFGENSINYLSGIAKTYAGIYNTLIVYNEGQTTGYGTAQAKNYTPDFGSGIDVQLKYHLGTLLNKDQSIYQWVHPYSGDISKIQLPDVINKNVVAISQGKNFTAAIIKRPCDSINQSFTGYQYIWELTGFSNHGDSYATLDVGTRFPPNGTVLQTCNCRTFVLPWVSDTGVTFNTGIHDCNLSNMQTGYFISIYNQLPILNIDYGLDENSLKTGFAGTGITTGDFWNKITNNNHDNVSLLYSNLKMSNISGGFIKLGTGDLFSFPHIDPMYSGGISGISGGMILQFSGFNTGDYKILTYGHGINSGNYTNFKLYKNGYLIDSKSTTSGVNFNSGIFVENLQYVKFNTTIETNDNLLVFVSGYLNGVQFINTNSY